MRSMTFGFLIVCVIKKKTKTKETNKTGEMLKAVSIKKTNLYMLHIVHRKSMVI